MKIRTLFACSFLLLAVQSQVYAQTYQMPAIPGDRVIVASDEETVSITVDEDQTLLDVARHFNLGQSEIVTLNPKLDRWLIKKGTVVRLPNRRILPDTPHEGITLNVAEYRMYYYPAGHPGTVWSFAHGVGRQDWQTPLGKTSVAKKVKNPAWHPPESIRREHAANGDPLPAIVPPGPHNPLGAYALHLALPGEYRIHGTDIDKIFGIGMQITHGCVRMYPEDIEALYNSVPIGTPVYIVKQPIKVGWLDNTLYVEAHPDLEGEEKTSDQRYAIALELIRKANNGELPEFDQVALNKALKDIDATPVPLYERLPPLEGEMPAIVPEPAVVPEPVVQPQPSAKVKAPSPAPVAAVKHYKPAVAAVAAGTALAVATKPKPKVVTASKSKQPIPVVASKSKKSEPVVVASKSKKPEPVVVASKSKKSAPVTSKTAKPATVTASKSKKPEPVVVASKSKKSTPVASKTAKPATVTASKSKTPAPIASSKTKKTETVAVSKAKKKEPVASKPKKQATANVSKSLNDGMPSGYYRGA